MSEREKVEGEALGKNEGLELVKRRKGKEGREGKEKKEQGDKTAMSCLSVVFFSRVCSQ